MEATAATSKKTKPKGRIRNDPVRFCLCNASADNAEHMVQCDDCHEWYHPGCVGKGKYKESMYKSKRKHAQKGDMEYYEGDRKFTCGFC